MASPRVPSALESLARLRTMRGLLCAEDRPRFERLIADVEQAVWDTEGVTADLARLVAAGILDAPRHPAGPVELTDVVAGALRAVDTLLASRAVLIDVDAPRPVFVMADRERLEHLVATALAIAASTVPARGHGRLQWTPQDAETISFRLCPYRSRDPRTVIVEALARSQGIPLTATDDSLTLLLPAAVVASL